MSTHETHLARNFDPTAYEYVGAFDNADDTPGRYIGPGGTFTMDDGSERFGTNWINAYETWLNELLRTSPSSRYEERYACDHCGARIRYVAVLRHVPTGDCIAAGETCLDHRFSVVSKSAFDALRKASAEARAEHRFVKLRAEFFATYPDVEAILWPVPDTIHGDFAIGVLNDMNLKLRRYGNLSEKQVEFARKLYAENDARIAKTAEIAAQRAAQVPAPEGRVEITGVVVSVKFYENDFGGALKMVVRDDRNFAVFCSVPSSLLQYDHETQTQSHVLVGDRLIFMANLTRSDRDETFAFGKRPTKARKLDAE